MNPAPKQEKQLGCVWILIIAENWKHCSKIIFKCVNNTVGEFVFGEKGTYDSREQCMRPTIFQPNANT